MDKFITFEGGEGVGKTTQTVLLKEFLSKQGKAVLVTREPGGSLLAEDIRALLLSKDEIKDPLTEYLLLVAARRDHINQFILPNLQRGYYVISDRFYTSSIVYQGYLKKLDLDIIEQINVIATNNIVPKFTFLLDADPKITLPRIAQRENKTAYDKKDLEFHQKIRQSFLNIAAKNSYIKVIDAQQNQEQVFQQIVSYF